MSSRPLYMDIYEDLFSKISTGVYGEEAPLPTERELCEKYHVSRSTVRSALSELQKNSFIYTVQGRGTFVKPQVIEQQLVKFYSFTDELKDRGTGFDCTVVDYQLLTADDKLVQKMGCALGQMVHAISRLRFAVSLPLMLEVTYLPQSRFHRINTMLLRNASLYEYLRVKYGLHVDRITETFQPILPSIHERELLCIGHNAPCMLLERFGYEDEVLVEYTRSVVRGDKYIFKVSLDNRSTGTP